MHARARGHTHNDLLKHKMECGGREHYTHTHKSDKVYMSINLQATEGEGGKRERFTKAHNGMWGGEALHQNKTKIRYGIHERKLTHTHSLAHTEQLTKAHDGMEGRGSTIPPTKKKKKIG